MSETLTLQYNLAELPSSQHRAGLAGLVLMVRWLAKEPDKKGICEITQIDETSATLQIDQEGLQFLFDKVYAATNGEKEENKPRKKNGVIKPPLREVNRTVIDKSGKRIEKTFYIYQLVIPHGSFLVEYDRSKSSIWIKLWRDMLWQTVRGRDKQRLSFQKRANFVHDKNVDKLWVGLKNNPNDEVKISSTIFIGIREHTAEDVNFTDKIKFQFLLNFWMFVVQIYRPQVWKFDKSSKKLGSKYVGYALVFPDVADLDTFCEEITDVLKSRNSDVSGYVPKESVIDVFGEGALDLMSKLNQRIINKQKHQLSDLLVAVDVYYIDKPSDDLFLLGFIRIEPNPEMIDKYQNAKDKYGNPTFRQQAMLNVLNEKEWYCGFDSLLSKTDSELTIGSQSSFFQSDVRKAFEDIGVTIQSRGVKNMETETTASVPKTLESVIYQLVRTYIYSKLEGKYQLTWNSVKGNPAEEKKYNEMKGKIAREAFLAIRSRTGTDFTEYFASTLCSYYQFSLKGDGFDLVAKALQDENEKVRTLTMLALSANGYSQRENQEKTQ